jgi:hypothetical protein
MTSLSVVASASQERPVPSVSIRYSFATPVITKISIANELYDQVTLQGAPCSGNAGDPNLPTKGAYLLLPPNTKVERITITGEKHQVASGLRIVPCGVPLPITPDVAAVVPVPNEDVYSSDDLFPGLLYTEVGVYQFRGYTILVLMLYPVQYLPATGDLFVYSTLDVTVTVTEDQHTNSFFRGLAQDQQEVLTKVDNPEVVETYQELQPGSLSTEQYDLLILTTDALKSGFQPLAEAHNATGVATTIRTLTDVGGTTPENIRDYIRTAYSAWGIDYVLLGGDDNVIPARILWVEGMDENVTHYEDNMPADHYFGCLDGPYNSDGDEKWGEPTDGEGGGDVDLLAEVYVGRACAGSLTEVNNFVSKTTAYLSLNGSESYLGDATFAGEYLGDYGIASYGGTTLDQLINGSSADGYTTVGIPATAYMIDKLHDEDWPGFDPENPWDTGWPKEEIINRINNGVFLINHDGHANSDYNMRMTNPDVNTLTNTKYCFIYSQGCISGAFDGGDCIAEYFTVKNTHGAFAGIWNARYGFFWSYSTDGDSQRYQRQFWDAVFGENKREIGRANHDSKEDNLFMIQRSCMRWCYYETNLFGDPAVPFKNAPQKPQLTISKVKGGFGVVLASITNDGDGPATDVEWSLTVKGGILGKINLSSSGIIESLGVGETITVQPENETIFGLGKVTITVTVTYTESWTGTAFVFGPFVLRVTAD